MNKNGVKIKKNYLRTRIRPACEFSYKNKRIKDNFFKPELKMIKGVSKLNLKKLNLSDPNVKFYVMAKNKFCLSRKSEKFSSQN